jgi:hypothetical protein
MPLATIPLRFAPPGTSSLDLIEVGLQQPPHGQRDQLDLKGPQDRLLRPGLAFLHAQAWLVVTESIVLPEARGPGFHHLRGRQIQSRGDEAPGLRVPRHLDNQDMHGDLRPADRPAAPELFALEAPRSGRDPGLAGLPAYRPVYMMWGSRDPGSPCGRAPFGVWPNSHRVIQSCLRPQPRYDLDATLAWLGLQTWSDHGVHCVGAIKDSREGGSRLCIGLPQQLDRQGRLGGEWFAHGQLGLALIQPGCMAEIRPGAARHQIPHHHPVVGLDRLGPIATAGTRLVKRASSPDLFAGTVPFGIVDRPRVRGNPSGQAALARAPGAFVVPRPPDPKRRARPSVPARAIEIPNPARSEFG